MEPAMNARGMALGVLVAGGLTSTWSMAAITTRCEISNARTTLQILVSNPGRSPAVCSATCTARSRTGKGGVETLSGTATVPDRAVDHVLATTTKGGAAYSSAKLDPSHRCKVIK